MSILNLSSLQVYCSSALSLCVDWPVEEHFLTPLTMFFRLIWRTSWHSSPSNHVTACSQATSTTTRDKPYSPLASSPTVCSSNTSMLHSSVSSPLLSHHLCSHEFTRLQRKGRKKIWMMGTTKERNGIKRNGYTLTCNPPVSAYS